MAFTRAIFVLLLIISNCTLFYSFYDQDSTLFQWTLCKAVRTCLELAEKAGHKSIAFPALGTGNLNYPVHLSATFMLREVLKFNNDQLPVSLKEVHFVLLPKNQQVLKGFQDVICDFNTKSATDTTHIDGNTSIGNMKISISVGDITAGTHCAVVNSTNNSLDDQKGVSGAILSAAGNSVQQELQHFGKQNDGAVVVTGPRAMNCKKIIHVVEMKDMNTLRLATIKVLEKCSSGCLASVSFPALLTENAALTSKDVAKTMYEAFDSFIGSNQQAVISQIQMVLFRPEMYLDFCKVFSECSSPKVLPSRLTNIFQVIPSRLTNIFQVLPSRLTNIFQVIPSRLTNIFQVLPSRLTNVPTTTQI
uniref:protein mono-ADP-ribosyltransferase PARP14-like n=1 Tax=Myxine glutinosa TaxID=7769 RepID=UPI00358E22FE